ncbi:MAG: TfoX/Sxy family protein [PS1 clade bacterium]|nr:TfoX/Sxy family protein [PS1 clade bacterium]
MSVSDEYKSFVAELFEPLGTVQIRHMFGGAGVYYRDVMFALISNETLYLKADDVNRLMFEAADTNPFLFKPKTGKNAGKSVALSFWELPEELLDDPDALLDWLNASVDAAFRSKARTRKKPRKP